MEITILQFPVISQNKRRDKYSRMFEKWRTMNPYSLLHFFEILRSAKVSLVPRFSVVNTILEDVTS